MSRPSRISVRLSRFPQDVRSGRVGMPSPGLEGEGSSAKFVKLWSPRPAAEYIDCASQKTVHNSLGAHTNTRLARTCVRWGSRGRSLSRSLLAGRRCVCALLRGSGIRLPSVSQCGRHPSEIASCNKFDACWMLACGRSRRYLAVSLATTTLRVGSVATFVPTAGKYIGNGVRRWHVKLMFHLSM